MDAHCLRRADRLIVDSREQNAHLGKVAAALARGALPADDIHGELGQVLARVVIGREQEDQITIAKLAGGGVQDVAAAEVAIAKLRGSGLLW